MVTELNEVFSGRQLHQVN